jgi:hypothetical protein
MKIIKGYMFIDAMFRTEDINYEAIGLDPQYEAIPIRFKLSEVVCWNEATDGKTRVVLDKSGFNFNIDMDIYSFDQIMMDL